MDLRPLLGLSELAEKPSPGGLSFRGSAATRVDKRIAEISEIRNDAERARVLFDYLQDWVLPRDVDAATSAPKPDELFPVDAKDGRLEVGASSPTEAEKEDALKRAMHTSLPGLLDRLAQAAGNQFPQLADRARNLKAMLDRDFEVLDLPMIHLMLAELRAAQTAGQEEGLAFSSEVVTRLGSVMTAGPALTVDNPQVNIMLERVRRYRDAPEPPADMAAQNQFSAAVAADDRAIGDRLRRLEERVTRTPDPEAKVAQKAANRNVLWKIAIWGGGIAGTLVLGEAGSIVHDLYGGAIVHFVSANWEVLLATAQTYGAFFAEWFVASVSKIPEIAAVIASTPDKPVVPPMPKKPRKS